jgi:hypothetical protein
MAGVPLEEARQKAQTHSTLTTQAAEEAESQAAAGRTPHAGGAA